MLLNPDYYQFCRMSFFFQQLAGFVLFFGLICCSKDKEPIQQTPKPVEPAREFYRGADLSFLPEIRQSGTVFYDSANKAADALHIFKNYGCNLVRIRIWNNPASSHSAISEVQTFAAEVKANGMKVLLDFHYSDSWADPMQQTKPAAWKSLSDSILTDSVYQFTKKVIQLVQPELVQIGNEINGGLLWENGRISNPDRFVRFLNSGIRACREVLPSTKIIIHFAGISGSDYFYNLLKTKQVDYDVIGLSYYPQWHGKNLDTLENRINRLAETFQKKLILAECAYPFSLLWADYTNNTLGLESQIIPEFPATPTGQNLFMQRLRKIMVDCPNSLGFCYWAPEWIAFNGPTAANGSHAENQAMFDFNHKALPILSVYKP